MPQEFDVSLISTDVAIPDGRTLLHFRAPKEYPAPVVAIALPEAAMECSRMGQRLAKWSGAV